MPPGQVGAIQEHPSAVAPPSLQHRVVRGAASDLAAWDHKLVRGGTWGQWPRECQGIVRPRRQRIWWRQVKSHHWDRCDLVAPNKIGLIVVLDGVKLVARSPLSRTPCLWYLRASTKFFCAGNRNAVTRYTTFPTSCAGGCAFLNVMSSKAQNFCKFKGISHTTKKRS